MIEKIDCPCGFGKNIGVNSPRCGFCGTDLKILFDIINLPYLYLEKGIESVKEKSLDDAMYYLNIYLAFNPNDKNISEKIIELKGQLKEDV